ncbi:hypothetical protein GOBAR_AA05066 [Gossypium barbadense]|uniref:Uncharacterized protein n=1 Tax=Gossypium barbadense TaxID=3634 RepID=A0A2P5YIT9_GOSBA|nr:hypothetical protein GOBAR_AA05066 [Gossypium barbadense]
MSETHFQNIEIALKNQQASIQGLKTQLNTINVQDEEGFVEPEPEQRQETVEMSLKEVHEPFSSSRRGPIHENRRLQIEELDEWRMHKPRTHDKPKLRQNKLNTFPNQLKGRSEQSQAGSCDTVVCTHTLKEHGCGLNVRSSQIQNLRITQAKIGEHGYTMSSSRGKKATIPASKKRKGTSSSSGPTTEEGERAWASSTLTMPTFYGTERHRKGVISIGPYVTQLARNFGLLNTAAQESSLTLNGQMSPQSISSMLSMRMIEKCQGTYPPQYRLTQSTEEEATKDITDDVPPQYEDPPSQPPLPSHPFMGRLHMLTSLNASLDSSSSDLWTNEPLPPLEYPPPPSCRLFSKTPI